MFREFVQKLSHLDRPLEKLPHSERRRANGHLRGNGARRPRVTAKAVNYLSPRAGRGRPP